MAAISKSFVLAGSAIFTVEFPATAGRPAGHHTYRVDRVEASDRWAESYFAKLLTGPDNTDGGDYSYLGKLDTHTSQVKVTAKSQHHAETFPLRLLNRILARVWSDDAAAYEQHGYKTHHEGRCGRCGRRLTVPASIESGIGPECNRKIEAENATEDDGPTAAQLAEMARLAEATRRRVAQLRGETVAA